MIAPTEQVGGKKTRLKITIPNIRNREEAEAVMNELAATANTKRTLTARLDAEVLRIKDHCSAAISDCDSAITARMDALRVWAESHPEEFPKGKKSITFLAGVLGFRIGMPKLALLSRAWNWDKVLEAVQARAFSFTRTKVELDKDAIIAFAAASPTAEDRAETEAKVLRPIGVKITQDESFYVAPTLTDTEVNL